MANRRQAYENGMLLICLHGPPGVGKLSVGRQLQRMTDYILIHDHLTIESATVIFPFGARGFSSLRSGLFASLLQAALTTRRGIIVTHADDVFWDPPFDDILEESAGRQGYSISRVLLGCSDEEHELRISSPERANYQKITEMRRLKKLSTEGEFTPRVATDDDLVMDTTGKSPADVAYTIAESFGLVHKAAARAT